MSLHWRSRLESNTATQSYAINRDPTVAIQQLLGNTLGPSNGNTSTYAIGFLDERGNLSPPFRLALIFRITFTSQAGLVLDDPLLFLQSSAPSGVMLFRSAVPEPLATCYAICAFLGLTARRRHGNRHSLPRPSLRSVVSLVHWRMHEIRIMAGDRNPK